MRVISVFLLVAPDGDVTLRKRRPAYNDIPAGGASVPINIWLPDKRALEPLAVDLSQILEPVRAQTDEILHTGEQDDDEG